MKEIQIHDTKKINPENKLTKTKMKTRRESEKCENKIIIIIIMWGKSREIT